MNETKQQTFPHPLISLATASACHTMPPLFPPAVNLKKMSIQENPQPPVRELSVLWTDHP